MSNNSVSITNHSGLEITGVFLSHGKGTIMGPPSNFPDQLKTGSSIANGKSVDLGTIDVEDGSADWWLGGIALNGVVYLLADLETLPVKKCDSPDGGATVFDIQPELSQRPGCYAVTIETYHSDKSSDGNCSAIIAQWQTLQSEFGELEAVIRKIIVDLSGM